MSTNHLAKYAFFTLLVIVCISVSVQAQIKKDGITFLEIEDSDQSQSCAALAEYKDSKLIHEWEKATAKYTISSEAKKDLLRLREELLSDNTWENNDWPLLTSNVAENLKVISQLFSNSLKLNPATGAVSTSIPSGTLTADHVLKSLETGESIEKIAEVALTVGASKEFIDGIKPVGQIIKNISSLSDDVKKLIFIKEQKNELRKIIKQLLDDLDTRINDYERRMASSTGKSQTINVVSEAIDRYCQKLGRVETLKGKWMSAEDGNRFRLDISGNRCIWVERNSEGVELSRAVNIVEEENQLRIYRPNDDEVLTFLGFQASLRAEILAQNPEPSFLILTQEGDRLKGEWHGLLATKDNKAKLKDLKQPKQMPGKEYIFVR